MCWVQWYPDELSRLLGRIQIPAFHNAGSLNFLIGAADPVIAVAVRLKTNRMPLDTTAKVSYTRHSVDLVPWYCNVAPRVCT